jgi:hypothetical protein
MRTLPKAKKPSKVYYIHDSFGDYIGPYANKPSQKMLDKFDEAKVITFKLSDVVK